MEVLYEKYENIQKFIIEYRKYILHDDTSFYDFKTFKKNIQIEQFIKHKCINPKNNRLVYIYMFRDQSIYIKTTAQFKKLIDKIAANPADVIIISKLPLSVYINKALISYNKLSIHNYLYKYFAIELSKGPLCSKHTILSNNEVKTLCSQELIIHPLSLPAISVNDPQNIWIGGELGQVIKIESISEITGKSIRYRIVSPDSGTILNIQKLKENINDNSDKTDKKNKAEIIKNVSMDEIETEYDEEYEEEEEEDTKSQQKS